MTKPKVRVVVDSAIIHLASRTEPRRVPGMPAGMERWTADWISDPRYGDTLGYVDWSKVSAVTWRWSE